MTTTTISAGHCHPSLAGMMLRMGGRRRRHGFGGWPGGFGGARRAGRGDIRAAILALLAEQPMHGYQIIGEIAERSQGAWRPSPGSVYPTLQQLEDEQLVTAAERDGRRTYELTDAGRREAESRGGAAPWDEAAAEAGGELADLRELATGLMIATRLVARDGDPAKLEAAAGVLRDARRRLYQLLAGEPGGEPPTEV